MTKAKPQIILIAAMGRNRVIGKDGNLFWKFAEDMKHFKETTTGHTVIMGRKTFDSLNRVALPNRDNIVIQRVIPEDMDSRTYCENPTPASRDDAQRILRATATDRNGNKVNFYTDLHVAINGLLMSSDKDIYVIGGGEIYSHAILRADKLIITHIDEEGEGDTYFPEIPKTPEETEGFGYFEPVSTVELPGDNRLTVVTYERRYPSV